MSRTHSRSPPLPSPSATSSPTSTTTNMNVNYAPAPTSFPSTTDAWMGSRPTVSPLKTADDAYSRSSSSSFYASTNLAPSPPPSLHQSTPRAQWLASHDSGRRASYGQYPPTQQYSSPGPLGSPQEDHWSPNGHHAHSPGSYLPQTQSYQQYHPSQPQQPPAAYPAAVPLNQSVHIGSVPMPVPLGSSQPRRRGKLPKATTEYLKDWLHKHSDHPYPTEDEKKRLCAVTGLSMSQVSNWMINVRSHPASHGQQTAPQCLSIPCRFKFRLLEQTLTSLPSSLRHVAVFSHLPAQMPPRPPPLPHTAPHLSSRSRVLLARPAAIPARPPVLETCSTPSPSTLRLSRHFPSRARLVARLLIAPRGHLASSSRTRRRIPASTTTRDRLRSARPQTAPPAAAARTARTATTSSRPSPPCQPCPSPLPTAPARTRSETGRSSGVIADVTATLEFSRRAWSSLAVSRSVLATSGRALSSTCCIPALSFLSGPCCCYISFLCSSS